METIARLTAENAELKSKVSVLGNDMSYLETQVEDITKTKVMYRDDADRLFNENESLEEKNAELQVNNKLLAEKNAELEKKLQTAEDSILLFRVLAKIQG